MGVSDFICNVYIYLETPMYIVAFWVVYYNPYSIIKQVTTKNELHRCLQVYIYINIHTQKAPMFWVGICVLFLYIYIYTHICAYNCIILIYIYMQTELHLNPWLYKSEAPQLLQHGAKTAFYRPHCDGPTWSPVGWETNMESIGVQYTDG